MTGYWKYWPDYSGIKGLLERGYDVLGISAMYNHFSFSQTDVVETPMSCKHRSGYPMIATIA